MSANERIPVVSWPALVFVAIGAYLFTGSAFDMVDRIGATGGAWWMYAILAGEVTVAWLLLFATTTLLIRKLDSRDNPERP